jgi:hypothetical protein
VVKIFEVKAPARLLAVSQFQTDQKSVAYSPLARRPGDPNQLANLIVDIATGEAEDVVSETERHPSKRRMGGIRAKRPGRIVSPPNRGPKSPNGPRYLGGKKIVTGIIFRPALAVLCVASGFLG